MKVDDLSSSDSNSIRKRRIERELFWISKLRTAYPLGLNDKISGLGLHGNLTDSRFVDYNIYRVENVCEVPQAKIRRNRHKKKKRRSTKRKRGNQPKGNEDTNQKGKRGSTKSERGKDIGSLRK